MLLLSRQPSCSLSISVTVSIDQPGRPWNGTLWFTVVRSQLMLMGDFVPLAQPRSEHQGYVSFMFVNKPLNVWAWAASVYKFLCLLSSWTCDRSSAVARMLSHMPSAIQGIRRLAPRCPKSSGSMSRKQTRPRPKWSQSRLAPAQRRGHHRPFPQWTHI